MDLSLYQFRNGEPADFDILAAQALLLELGARSSPNDDGLVVFDTTDGSAAAPLWISRRGEPTSHAAIDCYIRSDRGFLNLLLEVMTKFELAAVYPEDGTLVFPLALAERVSDHLPLEMEQRTVSNADELARVLGCV